MASGQDSQSRAFARVLREAGPYLGMGTALAVTVGLAFGLGVWLDGLWGTKPGLALSFGSLGVVVALVQFVRMAATLNRPRTMTAGVPIQANPDLPSPDLQSHDQTKP
jgi:hypothetical protein